MEPDFAEDLGGFVKLYQSVLSSSLWDLDVETRLVFFTMLVSASPIGFVRAATPTAIQRLANIPLESVERALAILEAPDPASRSEEEDGKRVVRVRGGWMVVNLRRYRDGRDPEKRREQNREAQRKHRDKASSPRKPKNQQRKPRSAQADLKLNPSDQILAVVAPPHTAPRGSDLGNSPVPLSSDPGADPQLDLPCARANGPGDQAPHPAGPGEVPPASSASRARRPAPASPATLVARSVWEAYAAAYHTRYDDWPVRNARVNGQLARFVRRVPAAEAALIAEHYVRSQNARYVAHGHSIGCLLADAEKLRTEWATGKRITAHSAREQDKQAGRFDAYQEVLAQAREIDRAAGRISK